MHWILPASSREAAEERAEALRDLRREVDGYETQIGEILRLAKAVTHDLTSPDGECLMCWHYADAQIVDLEKRSCPACQMRAKVRTT